MSIEVTSLEIPLPSGKTAHVKGELIRGEGTPQFRVDSADDGTGQSLADAEWDELHAELEKRFPQPIA
jgi:hypothetical protein